MGIVHKLREIVKRELFALLKMEIYIRTALPKRCLLYTSDAADDPLCVDLSGRRIIKKIN